MFDRCGKWWTLNAYVWGRMIFRRTLLGKCVGIFVLSHVAVGFAESDTTGERIYERFREQRVVARGEGFAGEFSQTYDAPLHPGETITQRFEWKRNGDAWIYSLEMIQPDGVYYRAYSWDGQMSVGQTYNDGDIGRRPQEDEYYLDDKSSGVGDASRIERLIDVIDEDSGGPARQALSFDDSEKLLTVGVGGRPIERIHFTDLGKLTYSHIEYLDPTGRVMSTKIVDSWAEYEGRSFPKKGTVWNTLEAKLMFSFDIHSVETNPVSVSEEFVVELPNAEGVVVTDLRFKRGFYVSDLDPSLLERRKYLEATEKRLAEALAEGAQSDLLENVELSLVSTDAAVSSGSSEASITGTEQKVRIQHLTEAESSIPTTRDDSMPVSVLVYIGVFGAILIGGTVYFRRGMKGRS